MKIGARACIIAGVISRITNRVTAPSNSIAQVTASAMDGKCVKSIYVSGIEIPADNLVVGSCRVDIWDVS
jgi:hypothetical protein